MSEYGFVSTSLERIQFLAFGRLLESLPKYIELRLISEVKMGREQGRSLALTHFF